MVYVGIMVPGDIELNGKSVNRRYEAHYFFALATCSAVVIFSGFMWILYTVHDD